MKVDSYRFGEITINGKTYDHDVVLVGEEVRRWVRQESHNVLWSEGENLLESQPEAIIFGTGSVGVMNVPSSVVSNLQDQGVEVIVERTGKAAEIFNRVSKKKKVVAALHLTC